MHWCSLRFGFWRDSSCFPARRLFHYGDSGQQERRTVRVQGRRTSRRVDNRYKSSPLNAKNDWLGSGGVGGVPAYWQAGNKVFISDVGPGVSGVAGGVVALNVTASCTLQVAWSTSLGGSTQPDSTPTVANGVVFVGEGATGMVHAYDAQTGVQLWNSGSTPYSAAATYAAPIVAQGSLYVGSWSNFSGGGQVGAFSLNSPTQILSVSPTSLSFTAVQGGSNPASSTVNVTNTGVGTLTFNATSDSPWLTVSPASGSAPQNLQVGASVGGLARALTQVISQSLPSEHRVHRHW